MSVICLSNPGTHTCGWDFGYLVFVWFRSDNKGVIRKNPRILSQEWPVKTGGPAKQVTQLEGGLTFPSRSYWIAK